MYKERLELYKKMEEVRGSKLFVYITGDRQNLETQIHAEVLNFFIEHLDKFNLPSKISLYLYSRGGDTLAGWSIVNLIRQFCKEFEVIIPSKAHSTATLIALGADKIVMTKQATLGPIDPSINGPLNPQIPGAPPNARVPISVEAVASYFELAKQELEIKNQEELTSIFLKLSEHVHPLVLGNVYRARTQIQRLAERLLKYHMNDETKIRKIISVLCSESGSHDYTINRREARDELFLPIEKPDENLYNLIKKIYDNISDELQLNYAYDPNVTLGSAQSKQYSFTRCLIESVVGGSHKFVTEGVLKRAQVSAPIQGSVQMPGMLVDLVQDQKNFEGWKYESI